MELNAKEDLGTPKILRRIVRGKVPIISLNAFTRFIVLYIQCALVFGPFEFRWIFLPTIIYYIFIMLLKIIVAGLYYGYFFIC